MEIKFHSMARFLGKYVIAALIVYVFVYATFSFFGSLYNNLSNNAAANSFFDESSILGTVMSYVFFISLVIGSFTDRFRYWIYAVCVAPVIYFEIMLDLERIYIPILFAIAGWLMGIGLKKLWQKLVGSNTGLLGKRF